MHLPRGRAKTALITLLTDFGHIDPYVGIMKGVILGINPRASVVDLTHGIAPQNIRQGMIALEAAWPYFPAGTLHLAVVDPGVGSNRAPLAIQAGGHTFVGPDNGLFTQVLTHFPQAEVRRIDAEGYRLPQVSRTFHGRDIFAPAVAWLSRGVPISALGPVLAVPVLLKLLEPEARQGEWHGEVTYEDGFGNLITNLPAKVLSGTDLTDWRLRIGPYAAPLAHTYAEVEPGALVAVVGSFGVIEIAVNGGSAAAMLGVGQGEHVQLERVDPE